MNVSNKQLTELACAIQLGNYALEGPFFEACKAWVKAEISRKNLEFDGYSESANDFIQTTLIRIWMKLDQYDQNKGSFATWLAKLVMTQYCNSIKKAKPETLPLYIDGEDGDLLCTADNYIASESPEDQVLEKQYIETVEDSLYKLPTNQGRALYLSGQGLKPAKIAEVMGVNSADVSRWINRGRKKLKEDLERDSLSRDGYYRAA